MDFQAQLIFWVVVILAVLLGGPVLAVLGLFFVWLAPWLIAGALAIAFSAWLGRMIDKDRER